MDLPGGEGGDHPVWPSQTGLRRVSDGSQTGLRRVSDGSQTGLRRVSDGSQTGLRRVSDGVKNIRFFGEICCSRTIFARVFKVEIVLWY